MVINSMMNAERPSMPSAALITRHADLGISLPKSLATSDAARRLIPSPYEVIYRHSAPVHTGKISSGKRVTVVLPLFPKLN